MEKEKKLDRRSGLEDLRNKIRESNGLIRLKFFVIDANDPPGQINRHLDMQINLFAYYVLITDYLNVYVSPRNPHITFDQKLKWFKKCSFEITKWQKKKI